ncbi:hypothetical protein GOP47_0020460 [Adiantum capillus-veneris]|uniref:Transmembrane protein 131-like N-terminal domain-containing protein n=1 Tax=Adiantum capillus-veneris TaxID=13818 RepID=A0A9D4Z7G6_ADICA|nr:hypothetical protein GOP47_0020460 [Adiantum capillus-veneris]
MELSATATVLAMVLCASVRVTHDDNSGAAAQQRKLACSRNFWCCDRAPRGWSLFQLIFPWILLVLCMPCLIATAESMVTMEAEWLQPRFHSAGGGVQVHDQESALVSRPVIDDSKDAQEDEVASSKEGSSVTAPKDDCSTNLSRSSEAEPYGSLAQEELLPALCFLPGWSHVWQAFLSTNIQTDSSAEITLQVCSVCEEGVSAILDWGSNRLTSVAYKFLTITNRQSDAELRVSKILTSDAQFCTVNFQEMVLSAGSQLSILIAYIPTYIGKAEGIMLLQTSTGSFKVKNLGEGLPSLIKIHPALSLAVFSLAEWQETISLVNPFADHLSIKEAYVWMESSLNQIKGEGVFCRKLDFRLQCSYRGRLKVRPIAEWSVAPYSSTPVIDFSIIGDDREHLVGTLCLKIYRHSVQLSEVLVVPLKMERLGVAITSTEAFGKESLLQVEEAEEDSGWAVFGGKTNRWEVLIREEFGNSQRINKLIFLPLESAKLRWGVTKEIGAKYLIGDSGGKTLLTSRLCCSIDAFVSNKLLRHLKCAVYPAVLVPCSALSPLFANCGSNDDKEDRCFVRIRCAENSCYQDCLNLLLVPCKVSSFFSEKMILFSFCIRSGCMF